MKPIALIQITIHKKGGTSYKLWHRIRPDGTKESINKLVAEEHIKEGVPILKEKRQ